MKAKVGDWVRFYQDGVLVIGYVHYVNTDSVLGGEDRVLEVRP